MVPQGFNCGMQSGEGWSSSPPCHWGSARLRCTRLWAGGRAGALREVAAQRCVAEDQCVPDFRDVILEADVAIHIIMEDALCKHLQCVNDKGIARHCRSVIVIWLSGRQCLEFCGVNGVCALGSRMSSSKRIACAMRTDNTGAISSV